MDMSKFYIISEINLNNINNTNKEKRKDYNKICADNFFRVQ